MMSRLSILFAAFCLCLPDPAAAQDNRPVSLILRFAGLPDRVNRTFEDGQLTLVIGAWEFQPPREEPVHSLERQQAVFVVPWFDIQDTSIDCFRVDIEEQFIYPACIFVPRNELRQDDESTYFVERWLYDRCQLTSVLRRQIDEINWPVAPDTAINEWEVFETSFRQLFTARGGLHRYDIERLRIGVQDAARVGQLPLVDYISFPVDTDHDIAVRGRLQAKSLPVEIVDWIYETGLSLGHDLEVCAQAPTSRADEVAGELRDIFAALIQVRPDLYVASGRLDSAEDHYFNLMRAAIIMTEIDADPARAETHAPVWLNTRRAQSPLIMVADHCTWLWENLQLYGRQCAVAVSTLYEDVPIELVQPALQPVLVSALQSALRCGEADAGLGPLASDACADLAAR